MNATATNAAGLDQPVQDVKPKAEPVYRKDLFACKMRAARNNPLAVFSQSVQAGVKMGACGAVVLTAIGVVAVGALLVIEFVAGDSSAV